MTTHQEAPQSRPTQQRPDGKTQATPYAWHFRKLMDVLEQILRHVESIERAVSEDDIIDLEEQE